jgi:hypothetical protein
MSLGWLTRIGRHADASVRKRWAIVGAIATLALALLLPGYQDGLVVLTLLAAPFAFVAGTFRPTHPNESAYTWRGLSQAVLLIAVVTLLPLGRLFAYDPASTPGAPAPPGQSVGELTINRDSDGAVFYTTPSSGDTALIVEFWPASISGPFVVVDPTASAPVLVTPEPVDFANLPAYPQWWIVGVRTGTGGRTAAAMVIQVGRSPGLGTALGWLLSHI